MKIRLMAGEVTGGGSGVGGSNIDIEIYDDNNKEVIQTIREVIGTFYLYNNINIVVSEIGK
ncbi:hypothetical protein [Paenibacillus sp. H1-7]|uniref:hypothetical protein n=1 Tax=Paenibacillus sp. H1-7 TaxID=2282849 RepID=UPI001EF872A1|nr:hypothetical protein [Paenibacillus sp. H1-7]